MTDRAMHVGARRRCVAVLVGAVLAVGCGAGVAAASTLSAAPSERVVADAVASEPFTISGSLSRLLLPGVSAPLDLSVSNPNSDALRVTGLSVAITGVQAVADPEPGSGCSGNDFAVTQYSGSASLVVAGSATRTLSALGVTTTQLPQVRMLETNVNQDGCQGATLTLAYTGTATGGETAPSGGTGEDNGGGTSSSTSGGLSPTGAEGNAWPVTLAGLGLVVVGAAACLVARRRKANQQ